MVSGWAIQRQPALEGVTDDFGVDGKQLVGIAGGANIFCSGLPWHYKYHCGALEGT